VQEVQLWKIECAFAIIRGITASVRADSRSCTVRRAERRSPESGQLLALGASASGRNGEQFISRGMDGREWYVRCSAVLDLKTRVLMGEGMASANGQKDGLHFRRTRRVHVTCGGFRDKRGGRGEDTWGSVHGTPCCERRMWDGLAKAGHEGGGTGHLAFFSIGLRILNEHMRVSSTIIMAPALVNSPQ
jgi:hypothetical protein